MTRPRRGEPRAETKIVAAGRQLFALRGFAETSVGDIARKAEVARATVYNNFDDKQGILAAIVGEYAEGYVQIAKNLRSQARSGQTSFELVQEMIRESLAWRIRNADIQPILAFAGGLRGSGWEEASKVADEAMLGWILTVHAVDEAAGLIREDIDLEFGVRAAYAMIESVIASFDVTAGHEEIDDAARQLALLHWHSICSVDPGQAPRSSLGRTGS